jgi:hypothetical protein
VLEVLSMFACALLGVLAGWVRRERTMARRSVMGDLLYLGITVGFFLLTWAFVRLLERV